MFCKLFLLKNICRNTGRSRMHWQCRRLWGWSGGWMQEVFGEKRKLWRCSGDALGDAGKRGGRSHRILQAGAGNEPSLLSPGCLLRASGILESLLPNTQLDLPTTHHSSRLNFWPLHHPVGTLWAACSKGFSVQGQLNSAPGKG